MTKKGNPVSTISKAADVIDSALPVGSHITKSFSESAAKALEDAGLLMPDLPAPDRKGDWGPGWEGVVEAETGHYAVRILVEGRQFRQSSQYARLFALALLAAANHAEGQANE